MTPTIGTPEERELIELLLTCCKRIAAEMEVTAAKLRYRAALNRMRDQ